MLAICKGAIPQDAVANGEIVVRTIFSPMNLKKGKTDKLDRNFVNPKTEQDEDDPELFSNKLSCTRLLYAGMSFCREHGQQHSNPDSRRSYYGVAVFAVSELRRHEFHGVAADVLAKPVEDNPAHCNIRLPIFNHYPDQPGKPRSGELNLYLDQLLGLAKVYPDPQVIDGQNRDLVDEDITDLPLRATCEFVKEGDDVG